MKKKKIDTITTLFYVVCTFLGLQFIFSKVRSIRVSHVKNLSYSCRFYDLNVHHSLQPGATLLLVGGGKQTFKFTQFNKMEMFIYG